MAVNAPTLRPRRQIRPPSNNKTTGIAALRLDGDDGGNGMAPASTSSATRWIQLVFGIVCMSMLANLQYGWTMFVHPMAERHGWPIAAIQVAFSIFIITETWPQFAAGWVVDRYGPRLAVAFGGTLIGLSWVLNSMAESLTMLYVAAVVGGIGTVIHDNETFNDCMQANGWLVANGRAGNLAVTQPAVTSPTAPQQAAQPQPLNEREERAARAQRAAESWLIA